MAGLHRSTRLLGNSQGLPSTAVEPRLCSLDTKGTVTARKVKVLDGNKQTKVRPQRCHGHTPHSLSAGRLRVTWCCAGSWQKLRNAGHVTLAQAALISSCAMPCGCVLAFA